jgi:hypothetical protein
MEQQVRVAGKLLRPIRAGYGPNPVVSKISLEETPFVRSQSDGVPGHFGISEQALHFIRIAWR